MTSRMALAGEGISANISHTSITSDKSGNGSQDYCREMIWVVDIITLGRDEVLLEEGEDLGAAGEDGLVVVADPLCEALAPLLVLLGANIQAPGPHVSHHEVHHRPEEDGGPVAGVVQHLRPVERPRARRPDVGRGQQPLQDGAPLGGPLREI